MTQFIDYEGLQKFKECADAKYLPQKGTIPITDKINLTSENVLTLGAKVAKVANNSMNFYIIADSQGKLPSSETRINIPSSITSLVGAEGANVGDIFVVAKLNSLPVYRIIPLNDAKAANSTYAGTNGVMTPWDKSRVNKVDSIEETANAAIGRATNALNNLPTFSESNMNNALATGVYPWCTLGRPDGSTGAYTCITIHSTTKDSGGFDTIEQTAYGRQGELGKVYKRIIFKNDSETQFGDWLEISNVTSATKKSKPKTQYIIGKTIPIGNLNGGARFNAYAVAKGMLQLRLTNLGEYCNYIDWLKPKSTFSKAKELLVGVTWHIFMQNEEIFTGKLGDTNSISIGMYGAYLRICSSIPKGFYSLDESKSSSALAPDMYIYLTFENGIPDNFKGTSDALCFHEGVKVWTPKGNIAPYMDEANQFRVSMKLGHLIQLQRLHTTTSTSYKSVNPRVNYPGISYRGNRANGPLYQYGTYRYRMIRERIKTQWYTVDIMSDGRSVKDKFVVKKGGCRH